ncbi:hypothetical protein [Trichothermofontia sp.]
MQDKHQDKHQDKQKVTLYFSPELHQQLKIRAAVDGEPMSSIAERAIAFFLQYSDTIEATEALQGKVHRILECPECAANLVFRESELAVIGSQPTFLADEDLASEAVRHPVAEPGSESQPEQSLVTC